MSIIERDYLPRRKSPPIPPELALLIVRKAATMAATFESKALDQLKRDVERAIEEGVSLPRIARELGL